uniref:hypothetical protein n=1 Tax=uncultured Bacteroides sp. TaxID=162156 RepID=UPI00280BBA3C|nr:hypothetical protein [uncultured Bacteroides sp.]
MEIGCLKFSLQNFDSKFHYVLFFMPLIGTVIPAYIYMFTIILFMFFFYKRTIVLSDFVIISLFVSFFIFKSLQTSWGITELLFRYFLGSVVSYYYFLFSRNSFNLRFLLLFFCISVIIEAVLINTCLPPSYWGNYPDLDENVTHHTAFFGFYQRPYSVGCNATVSSTILCLILMLIESMKKNEGIVSIGKIEYFLSFIVVILFASGTGLFLYLLFWMYKFNMFTKIKRVLYLILTLVIVFYIVTYASTLNSENIFSKISSDYLSFLFDFKKMQIEDTLYVLHKDSLLLGANFPVKENYPLWNDFSLNDFILSLGCCGSFFFLLFLVLKSNRINRPVIFCGVLGLLHYGGIFSMVGQLIFGYSLALREKKNL